MSGINFASGMQMLFDAQQAYVRDGLEVFIRIENFVPEGDYIEVGVTFVPTGVEEATTGFTDILILPPPSVTSVSMHDIGMSGGKLMFGAKRFIVSDTFVETMMEKYPGIKGKYNVWRKWDTTASVMGFVYDNQLFSIENIDKRILAGKPINWILTCNSMEEYLEDDSREVVQP